MTFNPNRLTFDEGLERIRDIISKSNFKAEGRVITSRDEGISGVLEALTIDNVPSGFRKWELPVYLDSPSQLFVTVAEPGAKASRHAHEEEDGIRFVAGGSITFEGRVLAPGDWMSIPRGQEYDFGWDPTEP